MTFLCSMVKLWMHIMAGHNLGFQGQTYFVGFLNQICLISLRWYMEVGYVSYLKLVVV